jgi:hypothetical protein
MTIMINYQKRKNNNLFSKLQSNVKISLENSQNYIPIYDRFFSLNNTNYNSINLNHKWFLTEIKETKDKYGDFEHIYNCKLKKNNENDDLTINRKVFIKIAPLLDPYKYLCGKYNHNDPNLFNLPSIDKTLNIHPKIADVNNNSYTDSFFTYLSSQMLNTHDFIHGVDFYGSYLGIKKNFTFNIIDDLDHLIQSDFFNSNKDKLFTTEDYSHLLLPEENKKLIPLEIHNLSQKSALSAKSFDESIFENIFTNTSSESKLLSLEDIKEFNLDLLDITNTNEISVKNMDNSQSLNSGSDCSSRTSHTNDDDDISELNDDDDDDDNSISDIHNCSDITSKSISSNSSNKSKNNESEWTDDDSSKQDDESDLEEEKLMATIPKFPVQLICMECCEHTLDSLIINNELNQDEWFSALMQIIMILVTYQKAFSFTHNDLHTNNIMYVETKKPFLYYYYKKTYYKVPTYGKIYKIIDFGRAIYKFKGNIFCSDSFQLGGDAASQYNTEPYFNNKKPRLEPNFSFDLCRLACSIFDYIVDDFDSIKNISNLQNEVDPIVKLIVEWCIDDNGINVLYKNNGVERYPDFKLYKMIARCVHNHTPNAQLERSEFKKYIITKNQVNKGEGIMNIDDIPSYI